MLLVFVGAGLARDASGVLMQERRGQGPLLQARSHV